MEGRRKEKESRMSERVRLFSLHVTIIGVGGYLGWHTRQD